MTLPAGDVPPPDIPLSPSPHLPGWGCRRHDDDAVPVSTDDLDERFEQRMRTVHDALERVGDAAALAALEDALEAKVLAEDRAAARVRRRLAALSGLQHALSGLRRCTTVADILQAAPREFARACDLDRANLFKVSRGCMVMESAYWEGDAEGPAEMLRYARAHPPRLDHMLLETEMIRRRAPALVTDAANDPRVPRALADFSRTRSYVAAPIMPAGKVIGFVHADCLYSGRICDEIDRDLVWAFAEGFGYAFERTVMAERLQRQRSRARSALLATAEMLDDVAEDELRLSHAQAVPPRPAAGVGDVAASPSVADALTPREREVLRLMATGMTNKAIADELVVTVGTVKAHVKHVLRKLRASNRNEAVARYVRSAREQELRAVEALEV